jgi:hypothetical protein
MEPKSVADETGDFWTLPETEQRDAGAQPSTDRRAEKPHGKQNSGRRNQTDDQLVDARLTANAGPRMGGAKLRRGRGQVHSTRTEAEAELSGRKIGSEKQTGADWSDGCWREIRPGEEQTEKLIETRKKNWRTDWANWPALLGAEADRKTKQSKKISKRRKSPLKTSLAPRKTKT